MKTEKQHIGLYSTVDKSARTMQGVWAALSAAGHFGLAAFARYEAGERIARAYKIAEHLVGNGINIDIPALSAPICEYATPIDALNAMLEADTTSQATAKDLVSAMMEAGENPFFQVGLLPDVEKDMEEIMCVLDKVKEVKDSKEMLELNMELLKKYSGDYE